MPNVDPNVVIDDVAKIAHTAADSPKPFYRSKSFWAQVLMVGTAYFELLPAQYAPYIAAAVAVFMRYLTGSGLSTGIKSE